MLSEKNSTKKSERSYPKLSKAQRQKALKAYLTFQNRPLPVELAAQEFAEKCHRVKQYLKKHNLKQTPALVRALLHNPNI